MGNDHFTEDGIPTDTTDIFVEQSPKQVRLYIETSGSMNGFFRANYSTKFKTTVWSVFSGLEGLAGNMVYPLTNAGEIDNPCSLQQFKSEMNQGLFVSNAETQVPDMLATIISSLNYKDGETAILVSDMKYSPTGQKSMYALMGQYQTEIRNIIGKSGVSVAYVCAVSQYLDKNGKELESHSPYYFIILGNGENVAFLRNTISTWVENDGCYIESGDMGINYGTPAHSYINPKNMVPYKYSESTFTDVDLEYSDTCSFTLRINLNPFPWKAVNKEVLDSCLIIGSEYGSKITSELINAVDDHHVDREFQRGAYADYLIKVFDMPGDSEVIKWIFSIEPFDSKISSDFHYIITSEDEKELDRSFSFDKFIIGSSNGNINRYSKKPKRILISTTQQ